MARAPEHRGMSGKVLDWIFLSGITVGCVGIGIAAAKPWAAPRAAALCVCPCSAPAIKATGPEEAKIKAYMGGK